MTDALTARQELFCRHYVLGTSAAAAARAAGYAEAAARSQAWRLLQQTAIQDRIAALQGDRARAASALCAQLWEQVEEVRKAALASKAYGTALRCVIAQMRLFKTLGLPANPADTQEIIEEGLAAETEAEAETVEAEIAAAEPHEAEPHEAEAAAMAEAPVAASAAAALGSDASAEALLDRLDELIDQAGAASLAKPPEPTVLTFVDKRRHRPREGAHDTVLGERTG